MGPAVLFMPKLVPPAEVCPNIFAEVSHAEVIPPSRKIEVEQQRMFTPKNVLVKLTSCEAIEASFSRRRRFSQVPVEIKSFEFVKASTECVTI